jgi:hypothetical protein
VSASGLLAPAGAGRWEELLSPRGAISEIGAAGRGIQRSVSATPAQHFSGSHFSRAPTGHGSGLPSARAVSGLSVNALPTVIGGAGSAAGAGSRSAVAGAGNQAGAGGAVSPSPVVLAMLEALHAAKSASTPAARTPTIAEGGQSSPPSGREGLWDVRVDGKGGRAIAFETHTDLASLPTVKGASPSGAAPGFDNQTQFAGIAGGRQGGRFSERQSEEAAKLLQFRLAAADMAPSPTKRKRALGKLAVTVIPGFACLEDIDLI